MLWPILFIAAFLYAIRDLILAMPQAPIGLFLLGVCTLIFGTGAAAGIGYVLGRLIGAKLPKSKVPVAVEKRKLVKLKAPHQNMFLRKTKNEEGEWILLYAWCTRHGVRQSGYLEADIEDIRVKLAKGGPRLSVTRVGFANPLCALIGIVSRSPRFVFYIPEQSFKDEAIPLKQIG